MNESLWNPLAHLGIFIVIYGIGYMYYRGKVRRQVKKEHNIYKLTRTRKGLHRGWNE